ncbi:MAG TPA: putative 2OG-Fe(II) oxygenase [Steroidobacteraceae bacterium]|nr:putative 2OG-Fe(II) oxygenase [Steroidobacteraceae bacterium]
MNATANDIRRMVEAGRTADAEVALRRKLAEVPTNAEWRTLLARVLAATGRKPEAIAELGIAVGHAPGGREARLTLARLANELGQSSLAAQHARVLTERDARDSEAWSALGMAAFGLRNKREATRALRRAVDIAPAYGAARYNLAAVLADQERSEEALDEAAAALRHGAKPRSVSLVQTRALIQLDRFEDAERQLLALLRGDAGDVEAHGMLLQLRQLRGDEEPLAALRAAAQAPTASPRLRLAFANAARRSGATAEAEASLRELMKAFGPDPMLLSSLATVLQESARTGEALDAARAGIAHLPDDAVVAENFVVAALCAGATPEALPFVEKFRALKPRDQRWITYRLDIARLRGEEEFASWFDPARVVSIVDLPPPTGFATTGEFHSALLPVLQARHRQQNHPLDQSLRHGTQTSRNLLVNPGAEIATLLQSFRQALADMQSRSGRDPNHPFEARNLSPAEILGCWSVRLRRGGFHVNHIHPEGWVSSAYYASVPGEVDDATQRSGWLKFGEPRFAVPGLAPFLEVQPKPGRLVLFPSYLWHGTNALRDDAPRLSVAFDAVPQAELG